MCSASRAKRWSRSLEFWCRTERRAGAGVARVVLWCHPPQLPFGHAEQAVEDLQALEVEVAVVTELGSGGSDRTDEPQARG